jgi:putative photosynthetic complex assembly protein 2
VDLALPALFVVATWWSATRLILVLDRLPPDTYRRSLRAAVMVGMGAVGCIAATAGDATPSAAYLGFACAVALWGLPELAFLTGALTGPRRTACPARCGGTRHFRHAIEAILYNELAIAALGALIAAITWHTANRTAAWTYYALWAMRTSTKLNLFFGVRNWSEKLLPEHLRYLESFFKKQPMNLLFPLSVTLATGITWCIVKHALNPAVTHFDAVSCVLIATLLALGVLEHWFLVLPIPVDQLFGWGIVAIETPEDAPPRVGMPVVDAAAAPPPAP